MSEQERLIAIASRPGYGPEEEAARAELRLMLPVWSERQPVDTTERFRGLLYIAQEAKRLAAMAVAES